MEQRLPTEEADVTNVAGVEDVESGSELPGIDPSQIGPGYFAPGEITEITGSVARVGHRDITEAWTSMAKQPHRIPELGTTATHAPSFHDVAKVSV